MNSLNSFILDLLASYPTGSHDYLWPNADGSDGVTQDLTYQGQIIARANAAKNSYCSGLTFEVWLRACEAFGKLQQTGAFAIPGLDARGMRRLKSDWYVATGRRAGPLDALEPRGLGVGVSPLSEAQPGDFIQLWRRSGSGHSAIFLSAIYKETHLHGIKYWSTQPATKGIGERVEFFEGKNPLTEEIYITRAFMP